MKYVLFWTDQTDIIFYGLRDIMQMIYTGDLMHFLTDVSLHQPNV